MLGFFSVKFRRFWVVVQFQTAPLPVFPSGAASRNPELVEGAGALAAWAASRIVWLAGVRPTAARLSAPGENPKQVRELLKTPVLTIKEESCYILVVPRVKVGLPVCVRFRRWKCGRWRRSVVCGSFCF